MRCKCAEAKVTYFYIIATEEYILCLDVTMNNTLLMLQGKMTCQRDNYIVHTYFNIDVTNTTAMHTFTYVPPPQNVSCINQSINQSHQSDMFPNYSYVYWESYSFMSIHIIYKHHT